MPGHDDHDPTAPWRTESVAALDSAAAVLRDIGDRVTAHAERFELADISDVAGDLYDVERHLTAAVRRLDGALRRLG